MENTPAAGHNESHAQNLGQIMFFLIWSNTEDKLCDFRLIRKRYSTKS